MATPTNTKEQVQATTLRSLLGEAARAQNALVKELEEKLVQYEGQCTQWQQIQSQANLAKSKVQKYKFDIGGESFSTSRAALMRFPNTLFYCLAVTDEWRPDGDGSHFIDISPKWFDVMLEYLRDGTMISTRLKTLEDRKQLKSLLDYFSIPYSLNSEGLCAVPSEPLPPPPSSPRQRATTKPESATTTKPDSVYLFDGSQNRDYNEICRILEVQNSTFSESSIRLARWLIGINTTIAQEAMSVNSQLTNWRAMVTKLKQISEMSKEKVKLDIGGKTFSTTRYTLFKCEYFKSQLNRWQPDANGAYFVDKSPEYFDLVLDFLRTGEWQTGRVDPASYNEFARYVEYFNLSAPSQSLAMAVPQKMVRSPSAKSVPSTSISSEVAKEPQLTPPNPHFMGIDPNYIAPRDDSRRIVVSELSLIFKDLDKIFTLKFNTEDDVKAAKKTALPIKEGSSYKIRVTFRVQHNLVIGLQVKNSIFTSLGPTIAKDVEVLGTQPPRNEFQTVDIPKIAWIEAPTGAMSRGEYKAKVKFADQDEKEHTSVDYIVKIVKDWN